MTFLQNSPWNQKLLFTLVPVWPFMSLIVSRFYCTESNTRSMHRKLFCSFQFTQQSQNMANYVLSASLFATTDISCNINQNMLTLCGSLLTRARQIMPICLNSKFDQPFHPKCRAKDLRLTKTYVQTCKNLCQRPADPKSQSHAWGMAINYTSGLVEFGLNFTHEMSSRVQTRKDKQFPKLFNHRN